jgi:acetylornithine deacetylase ArgE
LSRPGRTPMTTPAQLLADLVRLPSVNPMGRTDLPPEIVHESRVTRHLEHELRNLGVQVRRQPVAPGRDNLVAVYDPPGPAPFAAIFEAHQDTVPVDAMTVDPFGAVVENGRLYGRGACDVKAGVAVMLAAFARLVRERPAGSAKVTLAFTVDEEHTFLGIQEFVKSGARADYAVVAEPTLLDIVRAHKGVVRWQVETPGRACHSSRPEQGVNAVYRMARLLRGVEEYAERLRTSPPDPLLGPPTLSVGRITGGVSPNTVPDSCRIEIDRRLIPGENPAAAVADLDAFLGTYPGVDFPFAASEPRLACPPLSPANSGELVGRLGRAIDAVVGRHEVHAVPYGTDASTLSGAGVPAVVFGPGDIAQAHTKDEWIDLGQLDPAAEILFRFACGG